MDDFETELKIGFLEEALQSLGDCEQYFLKLESSPNDPVIFDAIFRLAHSLKGSAKAVGFEQLGAFTHELESYLLKIKKGEISVQAESVSLLLQCNDHILKMVEALKQDMNAQTDCTELLNDIQKQMNAPSEAPASEAPATEVAPQQEIPQEIQPETPHEQSSQELGAVPEPVEAAIPAAADIPSANDPGFESTEPETVTEPAPQPVVSQEVTPPIAVVPPTPPPAPSAPPAPTKPEGQPHHAASTEESIRVSIGRLEKLMNFVGELVILQTVLREQMQATNSALLRNTVQQLGKVTKEVQDISMALRMVPLKQTFQKMQRIVRDTSASLGKKVKIELQGEETEVDKTVLENLGDPLVHLIRNAVDHGVESPEKRLAMGKPEEGKIILNAYHRSGNLVIEIKDDGAGINPEILRAKAVEKGILKPGAHLSDKDAYQLIFHNGFSTKAAVTDISGRGVGMDVVKTNIEKMQGDIQIETVLEKGTCFFVKLPLTLAIIEAMVICSEQSRYVVPLSHIHESVKPNEGDISFVTGMGELLTLRGESIPLYQLSALLGKHTPHRAASESIALVVRTGDASFAVLVDDIIGQYQVVIKKLGLEHHNLKGFNGSAILGNGRPALILELAELVSQFKPSSVYKSAPKAEPKNEARRNAA